MFTFVDRVIDGIDQLKLNLRSLAGGDHSQLFPIASPHTSQSFALYDGSLASVLKINGYLGQYFPQQHAEVSYRWAKMMQILSRDKTAEGMHFIWSYEYDPDGMSQKTQNMRHAMKKAAARRGINIDDVLEEEALLYGEICAQETQYLIIITSAGALPTSERRPSKKEARQHRIRLPKGDDAMLYGFGIQALNSIHEQHVEKIIEHLKPAGKYRGYAYERLNVYEALKAWRAAYDPATTGEGWQPRLSMNDAKIRPADGVRAKNYTTEHDYSGVMPAPLYNQMFSDNVVVLGQYAVVGERTYAPLLVKELASEPQPLEHLVARCFEQKLPVRINFYFSPDWNKANYHNRLLAKIGITESNKQIKKACNEMDRYREGNGSVYAYGVSATTWAETDVTYTQKGEPRYNTKKIAQRLRTLENLMQAWGGQQLETFFGCALEATLSATAGYLHPTAAPTAPQIEIDIIKQLPITRPAQIWKPERSIWFRTEDGALSPYEPFSSQQSCMITLVMGGMGYGKSNVISEHIQFFATHPDINELPYIRGMDFGASSAGAMDMIKEQLPNNKKHQVMFQNFTNDGSIVKNVMDTPLGCRYPLDDQFNFLVNWLTLLCSGLIDKAGAENIAAVLRAILIRAYEICDYDENNHHYNRPTFKLHEAPSVVQEAIEQCEIEIDEHTAHWEIVDKITEAALKRNADPELIYAAKVAQRYAVPEFKDLIEVCSLLTEQFKSMQVDGQPLTTLISQQLLNANHEFACFRGRTTIDISEARIATFDMTTVFGRDTGVIADRRRSVFFVVALRLLTEDLLVSLKVNEDEFRRKQQQLRISDKLLEWHLAYLEQQDKNRKLFWADELHRIGKVTGAFEILNSIGFEGRKYVTGILFGTQVAKYFPDSLLRLATTYLMFGANQDIEIANNLKELFNLSDDERDTLVNIRPPTAEKGAEVFCIFRTVQGEQRLKLHFQMGGVKRWAYATEGDERNLRSYLYTHGVSSGWARRVLAKHVKNIKREVARLQEKHQGADKDQLIKQLGQQLIDKYSDEYID